MKLADVAEAGLRGRHAFWCPGEEGRGFRSKLSDRPAAVFSCINRLGLQVSAMRQGQYISGMKVFHILGMFRKCMNTDSGEGGPNFAEGRGPGPCGGTTGSTKENLDIYNKKTASSPFNTQV